MASTHKVTSLGLQLSRMEKMIWPDHKLMRLREAVSANGMTLTETLGCCYTNFHLKYFSSVLVALRYTPYNNNMSTSLTEQHFLQTSPQRWSGFHTFLASPIPNDLLGGWLWSFRLWKAEWVWSVRVLKSYNFFFFSSSFKYYRKLAGASTRTGNCKRHILCPPSCSHCVFRGCNNWWNKIELNWVTKGLAK